MRNEILISIFLVAGLGMPSPGQAKAKAKAKAKKEAASGQLDMAAVRQVVKSKILEVQKCYTDLIIENMAKAGTVAVVWDIDEKGAVQNLVIKENTADDSALGGCVTEKVQNWTFPPAEQGKTFSATYTFKFGN